MGLSSSISPAQRSPRRCPCLVFSFRDISQMLFGPLGKGHGGVVHSNSSTAPLQPSRGREKEENQHQPMALTELRVTHTSGCHFHTGQKLRPQGCSERDRHTWILPPATKILTQTFPYRHGLTSQAPSPQGLPLTLSFSPQPLLLPGLLCC